MEQFKTQSYSKSALARKYFPEAASAHTAVNHLMAWIKRCRPLAEALSATGYQKLAKTFTPKEVDLIIEYLGEP